MPVDPMPVDPMPVDPMPVDPMPVDPMPLDPSLMPPLRAEVVGSLLRSRRLKDAACAAQAGRLPPADYRATLRQEIARVIARQEDMGLRVVTDGELARSSWFGFFLAGLEGF